MVRSDKAPPTSIIPSRMRETWNSEFLYSAQLSIFINEEVIWERDALSLSLPMGAS